MEILIKKHKELTDKFLNSAKKEGLEMLRTKIALQELTEYETFVQRFFHYTFDSVSPEAQTSADFFENTFSRYPDSTNCFKDCKHCRAKCLYRKEDCELED